MGVSNDRDIDPLPSDVIYTDLFMALDFEAIECVKKEDLLTVTKAMGWTE
jgi:hypothetical protein